MAKGKTAACPPSDIDAAISEVSTSYDFHRIQKVELNVMRLAFYELQYEKELDVAVVISEAKPSQRSLQHQMLHPSAGTY